MIIDFSATLKLKDLKNIGSKDVQIQNKLRAGQSFTATGTPGHRPIKYSHDGHLSLSPNVKSFLQKPTVDPLNINPEDERNGDDGLSLYSAVQSRNEIGMDRRKRNQSVNISNYSLPRIDDKYKTQDNTEPGKIINLRGEEDNEEEEEDNFDLYPGTLNTTDAQYKNDVAFLIDILKKKQKSEILKIIREEERKERARTI